MQMSFPLVGVSARWTIDYLSKQKALLGPTMMANS
jgi:hypothetical protein